MRLVDSASAREPEWVLAALQKHEAALLRYAASLVGETRAQDVVQDAFLRLCSQPAESVQGHLAAWLFTVCRNRAIELRRADRRLSCIEEKDDMLESPDSGPSAKLERAENLSRVSAAMAALPSKQREVLRLKVEAGLSYKDIAEVMNLTVGNVGFILHTAIATVRDGLEEQDRASRSEGSPR
ncbi:MAG TPA: sigma-70 family RNA polymerase sigma factor [Polyangiaceae bacterium]|nr:sigma-70 family RNA polymerase sigma factor [Polyangiaceae bacterium]